MIYWQDQSFAGSWVVAMPTVALSSYSQLHTVTVGKGSKQKFSSIAT
jgi:hypothetical protein